MKNILIVGAKSFVGEAIRNWLCEKHTGLYSVDVIDAVDGAWKAADFSKYDAVYQVAGIAHVKKETPELEPLFFEINEKMSYDIATAAKSAGVEQYIYMSTKGVYPSFVPIIDKDTPTGPRKTYGKSKLAGEMKLAELADDTFKVAIMRTPPVYGPNAPGSFDMLLRKLDKMFVFPAYKNQRSMIFIDNLCEFVHLVIQRELDGILVPQDARYVCTSDIVRVGAKLTGKKVLFDYISWPLIALMVKKSYRFKKVFSSSVFVHNFSINDEEYYVCGFEEAMKRILNETL